MSKLLLFEMLSTLTFPVLREGVAFCLLHFSEDAWTFPLKSFRRMNCATSIVRFRSIILSDTLLLRST